MHRIKGIVILMKSNIINVTPVSVPGCVRPGLVGADWQMVQNSGVAADQARPGQTRAEGRGAVLASQVLTIIMIHLMAKDYITLFQKDKSEYLYFLINHIQIGDRFDINIIYSQFVFTDIFDFYYQDSYRARVCSDALSLQP